MWAPLKRATTPALRLRRTYNSKVALTTKQQFSNVAIASVCCSFIGGVYYYSISKMKDAGDDVSEEIALHEATMRAVRESLPPVEEVCKLYYRGIP